MNRTTGPRCTKRNGAKRDRRIQLLFIIEIGYSALKNLLIKIDFKTQSLED
jgi:hypothetical protein